MTTGCRLPGEVKAPSQLWDMMINQRSGRTPKVPASRFNIDAHFHKNNDRPGSFGVLGGYFLDDDLSNFDPGLFNILPIEAMWMDPQQRKLLEVVYEALESGGITLDAINGSRTAVFAASFTADWQHMAFKEASFRHSLAGTGVDPGIISNRISHVFNLTGPSVLCNTACSSSLYALHGACNALRNNECEAAIVGGVNLMLTVDQQMNTAKLGVLSPTSECHTFDASADGYGRADGVGAIYLKRLSDAIRDGDPIRAVIRSSATNQNGRVAGVGITHPSRDGQAAVIAQAYRRGGDLDPRLTGYFEVHGTGTAVGDPLEVHAVSLAMNQKRDSEKDGPLLLGAVKTNIGHSEASSGLSAVIKAVLAVERGIIPPTYGLKNPSPKIKWNEWQVSVPTKPVPFPAQLLVRRVSINSFGYGGTNAHIVVEGAESLIPAFSRRGIKATPYTYHDDNNYDLAVGHEKSDAKAKEQSSHRNVDPDRPFLLPFSAHNAGTLQRNLDAHAKVAHSYDLVDLAHTLSTRRSVLASKAFAVASQNTLSQVFDDSLAVKGSFKFQQTKRKFTTAGFVFTGQGAQWARMGAELIKYSPIFAQAIRSLDMVLKDLPDGPEWIIENVLLEDASTSPVGDAEFSQPLCTAVQIALVQLLTDWGIHPAATVGHSSGEIAAAYAAGLLTASEAIIAAYYRGQITRDVTTQGAMLAVGLGADEVTAKYLSTSEQDKVVVACHNSPAGVTLSGDADAVQAFKERLDADGVFARLIATKGKAYHSHHMAPVAAKYEELVQAARASSAGVSARDTNRPSMPMVSSVTNTVLGPNAVLDEKYWSRNLRSPVLFNQAVQTLLANVEGSGLPEIDVLIEIGPHSAMSGPIKQIKALLKAESVDYIPTLLRGQDSAARLLSVAGELFLHNYPLDMALVSTAYRTQPDEAGPATIVDLPPYQWNYTRPFWVESRSSREQRHTQYPRHDVLGQLLLGSSKIEPTWRNILRLRDLPWLRDHCLGGEYVFPAAGYMAMAVEAITQVHELATDHGAHSVIESYILRDVSFEKALVTPDTDDGVEVIFNLRPSPRGSGSEWHDFGVSSISTEIDDQGKPVVLQHMAGSIRIVTSQPGTNKVRKQAEPMPDMPQRASGRAWNEAFRGIGFDFGPTFQGLDNIRFDGHSYEAVGTTTVKQEVDPSLGESRYVLHPAIVDSVLQLGLAALNTGRTSAIKVGVVPIQVDEVTFYPPTAGQINRPAQGHAWLPRRGVRSFEGSAQVTSAVDGQLLLEIVNMKTISYEAALPQKSEHDAQTLYKHAAGPYGEMSWRLDFASLIEDGIKDDVGGVVGLIDLALFRDPGLRVGEVMSNNVLATKILDEYPQTNFTLLLSPDEKQQRQTLAKQVTEKYISARLENVHPVEDEQDEKQSLFDIIIAPSLKAIHASVKSRLSRSGIIITTRPVVEWKVSNEWTSVPFKDGAVYRKADVAVPTKIELGHRDLTALLVYRQSPAEIAPALANNFADDGWSVRVASIAESTKVLQERGIDHVVVIADLEDDSSCSLLATATEDEFYAIQTITQLASSLLWITPGAVLDGKKPQFALVQGLARAVRAEQLSLDFRTIDVDLDSVTLQSVAKAVVRVSGLQQDSAGEDEKTRESEYALARDDKLHISRLVRNRSLNNIFDTSQNVRPSLFIPGYSPQLTGQFSAQGKLQFATRTQASGKKAGVKPGHVEIRVQASGLAREGVLVLTGSDYPTDVSYEVGGTVLAIGEGVSGLAPGDMVVGFNADKFSTVQQASASLLQKVDCTSPIASLVAGLTPFFNAVYGLETLARIRKGDTVLVLDQTGPSGAAAVRVAQANGAVPFVLAAENSDSPAEGFLDPDHVIRYRKGDGLTLALARLSELTGGKGVDIMFSGGSSVDPALATDLWRDIARFGRFVDPGRKDVLRRAVLDTVPLARGASYLAFDLVESYADQPEVLSSLLPRVVELTTAEATLPFPIRQVDLSGIDEAVMRHSEALHAPKTVIDYSLATAKPVPVIAAPSTVGSEGTLFNQDSSYLLVGCLGGLGRSLTAWMLQNGARRFVFLSRSGADAPSAARLVKDIEAKGAIVTVVRGDATVRTDVKNAVQQVSTRHPIRGVVHAAMVLRVSILLFSSKFISC